MQRPPRLFLPHSVAACLSVAWPVAPRVAVDFLEINKNQGDREGIKVGSVLLAPWQEGLAR